MTRVLAFQGHSDQAFTRSMFFAFLAVLIAALILTGGIYGKVELSQVDLFGWLALSLGLFHWKSRGHFIYGAPWPGWIARIRRLASAWLTPGAALAALMALHVGLYAWIQVWRYQSFQANAFDLSFSDQAIWSTAWLEGPDAFFHSSISRGGMLLSEHFSPIFLFFVPLYRLWDSVTWLHLFLPILLSTGALGVFALARKLGMSPWIGVFFAMLYLMHPSLRAANLFDFKEDAFYIPIFFGLLAALDEKHWKMFWTLVFAALLVKENAPIPLFGVGIWLLLQGERRRGALLCGLSAAAFGLINLVLMPRLLGNDPTPSVLAGRFSELGASTNEVLSALAFHPLGSMAKIARAKLKWHALKYLLKVLLPALPFIYLRPLREAVPWLLVAGLMAMNVLITPQTVGYHYELIVLPFLFWAWMNGFSRKARRWGKLNSGALTLALLLCVYGRSPVLNLRLFRPTDAHRALARELAKVPTGLSVATQSALLPHVDHRREAILYPGLDRVRTDVILESPLPEIGYYATERMESELKNVAPERYRRVYESPRLRVYCRPESCDQLHFDASL